MYKNLLLIVAFLISGCASYMPYGDQLPEVKYQSKETILISVINQRERVKRGKKTDFIGVYRVNFGIPISKYVSDISPDDELDKGSNLAEFLQRRLVDGMVKSNWIASPMAISQLPSPDGINTILNEKGATTWMILVLREWYFSTDMHFITSFNFDTDVDVFIYSADSGLSISKNIKNRDVIKEHSDRHNDVLFAYKRKLTDILNDENIKMVLAN